MANVARVACKRGMRKLLDQLGPVRLVHVVAAETIRPFQRLSLVGVDNGICFYVMTLYTPRSRIFQLVKLRFERSRFSGLVYGMAGIASGIQGGVPTPLLRYIQTGGVTFQAKIFGLAARKGFQRVVLVRRHVRIMALRAVAHRRGMNRALAGNGLLVLMTLQAERPDRGSLQFDASDVPGDPDFMAGETTDGNGRMNGFPMRLLFVAFQAFGRVRIRIQRDRMLGSLKGHAASHAYDQLRQFPN